MNMRSPPHTSATPRPTAGSRAARHLHGFPYATVHLDRNGAPVDPDELRRAMSELSALDSTKYQTARPKEESSWQW